MYVCICNAVTDRQIHRAVKEGACTLRDLRRELGVCSQCGKCGESVREVLDASLSEVGALSNLSPSRRSVETPLLKRVQFET